jgi:uncharacterized protein YodC (DUF2158 family)
MAVTWATTEPLLGVAVTGLSNNNMTVTGTGSQTRFASVGKTTGKWYWELVTPPSCEVGFADLRHATTGALDRTACAISWRSDGVLVNFSTSRISALTMGANPNNCIVGIALDIDQRKVWFARNNVWVMSGDPANDLNPTVNNQWFDGNVFYPAVTCNGYLVTGKFAASSFTYTPPAGFSALTEPSDWTGAKARLLDKHLQADIYDGGPYQITGTVTELGAAGTYRVRLFDRQSARCIRETWSAADGSYSFPYIAYRLRGYFTVAYDHGDNPLNAAIADFITPELMP